MKLPFMVVYRGAAIGFAGLTYIWGLAGVAVTAFAGIPVTKLDSLADASDFRFAILPDRTGGMREGVFELGVKKVEMLQPEFVMSIGDLIDGYTKDPAVWNSQWDEMEAILSGLSMPFYYVAGNHDVSNEGLLSEWKRRHGDPYYCFVRGDILFLVLNTEDRPGGGIGDVQIKYFREVIRAHADVSWILVFMHRPLWQDENQRGYEQVEELLVGHKYAVFSGHLHHYLKAEKNGMPHYILATCGGGSGLRGYAFGEFDHITWVTVTRDGPKVVNLALSGIVEDDLVNESNQDVIETLRSGNWLEIPPILVETDNPAKVPGYLMLSNPTGSELKVSGKFPGNSLVGVEPGEINLMLEAGGQERVPFSLIARDEKVRVHALNESRLEFELHASYKMSGKSYGLPASAPVRVDAPRIIEESEDSGNAIMVDGDLSDWSEANFTDVNHPMLIQEEWDWSGHQDGRFSFAVRIHDNTVYVAVRTIDDRMVWSGQDKDIQDRILVTYRSAGETAHLEAIASTVSDQVRARVCDDGLTAEFAFRGLGTVDRFRLEIGWVDHDRPENTKPSVLWWLDPQLADFGFFQRPNAP